MSVYILLITSCV